MAEAFHSTPLKHGIRRLLLRTAARLPLRRINPSSGMRILVIRPDHLGDVLLCVPALEALRRAYPTAEIHALVGEWSAEVLAYVDAVDYVLTLSFPGFKRGGSSTTLAPYQLAIRSARKLHRIGYHAALILRPDHWWGAMLASFAGIPQRIGYDHPDVKPFLTHAIPRRDEHVVIQNARLAAEFANRPDWLENPMESLPLRFNVSEADRGQIDDQLYARAVSDDKPIIAIHPGAGAWVKRWEAEKWAHVADSLAKQLETNVVFTGGDQERDLVQSIQAKMSQASISVVGETNIGGLAALYSRARIVLGVDSGPMHIAAAVGTPTVTLYGAADPVEFGTWGDPIRHPILFSDIGCRPCRVLDWGGDNPAYHPCVREIPVNRVLEAAYRALNTNPE